MPLRVKKFIWFITGLLGIVLVLLGALLWPKPEMGKLEIDYLSVGQGDSILIKTPDGQKILLDGGPDNTVIQKLGEYLPFFDRKIDLMILTHPHSDHVTGLNEVLRRYQVGKILYTGALHTAPEYITWLGLIKDKKINLEIIKVKQIINLGDDLKLEILYPWRDFTNERVENLNDTSLVAKLVYKNNSFLFVGDAEALEEGEILADGANLKSDVLKVGHHGSATATSQAFLNAVTPKMAVIEVGGNNQFGHPHHVILQKLAAAGVKVYRTDLNGDVRMFSDGENISVTAEKE